MSILIYHRHGLVVRLTASSSECGPQTRARVVVGLFALATETISLLDVQGEGGEADKVTCR
jgi:hypothetical protein